MSCFGPMTEKKEIVDGLGEPAVSQGVGHCDGWSPVLA